MVFSKEGVFSKLVPYKQKIDNLIKECIPLLGPPSLVRDACSYALSTGGKRFRPILVLMMGRAVNKEVDLSLVALSIEFFHTASLIADDLPCMDNDDERRNLPTVHKKFNESTALLASYALIAAGYEAISKSALQSPFNSPSLCGLAIENASFNTGLFGATGGQFLDINPPDLSIKTYEEVIQKKTISLFEISFVFGWLFAGGVVNRLKGVKKAAFHFGMAFQIADDLDDVEQDCQNTRSINYAMLFGVDEAKRRINQELELFYKEMSLLEVDFEEFFLLGQVLV